MLACAGHKQEKPEDFSDLYSLAKIGSKALETVNGVSYLIGSIPDLLYIASGALMLMVVSIHIQSILLKHFYFYFLNFFLQLLLYYL